MKLAWWAFEDRRQPRAGGGMNVYRVSVLRVLWVPVFERWVFVRTEPE